MKIRYCPTDEQVAEFGLPEITEWYGYTFARGEVVDVRSEIGGRLARHAFFAADEGTGNAAPPISAVTTDPAPVTELRAVHRGRGSYSIVQGDQDKEVLLGLNKEQASEFNALDDAARAAYLAERLQ